MASKDNQQPRRIPDRLPSVQPRSNQAAQTPQEVLQAPLRGVRVIDGQLVDADGQLNFDFMKHYLYVETFNA